MINHISIGVHNPEKVANILAELWNGYAMPFPVAPNSWLAFADDGKGTMVEITPVDTILVPGEGLPSEENFDITVSTEEHEAKFVKGDITLQFVATHLNINSPLGEEEIKAIAKREDWRVFTANRAEGAFQLVELWIENRFMLEVMTPEMTMRYVELMQPEGYANWLQIPLPVKPTLPVNLTSTGQWDVF